MRLRPLLSVVMLLLGAAMPGVATAATPVPTPAEQQLAARVNAYRASLGLRTLPLSGTLQREARWYAADMAFHHYFSHAHVDSRGRRFARRLAAFGIDDGRYYGQISAAGTGDPDQAFELFRHSPPHNDSMRYDRWRQMAVGVADDPSDGYGAYWVVDFGQVAPGRHARNATSITIALPPPLRVAAEDCLDAFLDARCVRARPAIAGGAARVEVQWRRGGRWVAAARPLRRTAVLVLASGEVARVRVVARGRRGSARPWRVFSGPQARSSRPSP